MPLAIVYCVHGTWRSQTVPMSANTLLDWFSLLIHTTRKSAIVHLAAAVKACPGWRPRYFRKGTKKAEAPGAKMGSYEIKELIPDMKDRSDVLHPRSTAPSIPKPGAFYEVLHKRLRKPRSNDSAWCDASAWLKPSTTFDFHTPDSFGYVWGLPILVPTCARKLFEQGLRK